MITGVVRANEPIIRLVVRGLRGRVREIEAVVDTRYTGWLTLPPAVIADLGLRWQTFGRGILADGSMSFFDVYEAKLFWHGRIRAVLLDEIDATPLVGMALLRGCELRVHVRSRGAVTIDWLPGWRRGHECSYPFKSLNIGCHARIKEPRGPGPDIPSSDPYPLTNTSKRTCPDRSLGTS